MPSVGRGKPAQFVPIRFVFRNKLTQDDRLLLAFDALILSQLLGREVSLGKIIHGDDRGCARESAANSESETAGQQAEMTTAALSRAQPRITRVKTSALAGEVWKRIEKITALLSSPAPPDLVLIRHCAECEFQARCRKIAVEKDDLSLLAGMSAKERQKLRNKGIFTVTQLSYTFRPCRRPKRMRDKREKYRHALKALAIREKKIHIVGSPELKIEGTPIYLDVEGLPDRDFYHLIGLRIGHGESAVQHSLWADTVEDEGKIWREFLAILETVEQPVLLHYGSYETTFIKRMSERHCGPSQVCTIAKAISSSMNLLSVIFGQIHFPTCSNGLKEIAGWLGSKWSEARSVGILKWTFTPSWKAGAGAGDGHKPASRPARRRMQSPAQVVSLNPTTSNLSRKKKPNGFKPTLLNAAAASGVKSIARTSLPPERKLFQLLWLFGGRKLTLELEQGVFDSQQQFFALVPFFFADAAKLEGDPFHGTGELVHFLAQVGNGFLVRARVPRRVEKIEKALNELLQNGGDFPGFDRVFCVWKFSGGGFRHPWPCSLCECLKAPASLLSSLWRDPPSRPCRR